MNNFVFENSSKVYFGEGCVKEYLSNILSAYGNTVMLCYGGGSIKKNGIYDEVITVLKKENKAVVEFSGIPSNPTYSKVRAIGLSNFNEKQICKILNICEVKPSVLQTEVHPYYQEKELKKFLSLEDIKIQAWYPLGHGDNALLNEPLFKSLAEKYGKSTAQIILRWHIQDGNIVIPGSKNSDHIKANFDIFDFSLTDEETAEISSLDKGVRYYTSTPEMLKKYAEMIPPVDEQK